MLVKDIMSKKVIAIDPNASIKEAVRMMCDNNIGCLVIEEKKRLRGILTERDIIRILAETPINNLEDIKVSNVMTRYVFYVRPEDKIEKAIELIRERKIKKLPVLDSSEKLVGIITASDIVLVEPEIIERLSKIFSKEIS